MNSRIQKLFQETGATKFRADTNSSMSLSQAKRFSDAAEGQISSTRFASDDEFFETLERVKHDWPDVELRFEGMLDNWGYIDCTLVCYDDVIAEWEDDDDYFREYMVVHFKNRMGVRPEDNEGVCPFCDDRIDLGSVRGLGNDALFRMNGGDDNLWAAPDEFDFREYPQLGKCVRMWWDD